MKIVLDTNILISAFLKPQSNSARILRLILQGNLSIVVNEYILADYYEVLARPKFDLSFDKVNIVAEFIRTRGIKALALAESFSLPDRSDVPFLEAALATRADALITGNKKHFPSKSCKGRTVISTREFISELGE